ncbi:hypothetical protein [Isoptericola hypogeus]|uniref:hypothetical protein n=1 Tax=Isoptericola hypogeus TaxID=300179 RepID=UPI0031DF6C8C
MSAVPTIRQVVLDTTGARGLAELNREMFGLACRPGDEPRPPASPTRSAPTGSCCAGPVG